MPSRIPKDKSPTPPAPRSPVEKQRDISKPVYIDRDMVARIQDPDERDYVLEQLKEPLLLIPDVPGCSESDGWLDMTRAYYRFAKKRIERLEAENPELALEITDRLNNSWSRLLQDPENIESGIIGGVIYNAIVNYRENKRSEMRDPHTGKEERREELRRILRSLSTEDDPDQCLTELIKQRLKEKALAVRNYKAEFFPDVPFVEPPPGEGIFDVSDLQVEGIDSQNIQITLTGRVKTFIAKWSVADIPREILGDEFFLVNNIRHIEPMKVLSPPSDPTAHEPQSPASTKPAVSQSAIRSLGTTIRHLRDFQTNSRILFQSIEDAARRNQKYESLKPTVREVNICYFLRGIIPHILEGDLSRTQIKTFMSSFNRLRAQIDTLKQHTELTTIDTEEGYRLDPSELEVDLRLAITNPLELLKKLKADLEDWLGFNISREDEEEAYTRAAVALCLKYQNSNPSVALDLLKEYYQVDNDLLNRVGFAVSMSSNELVIETRHPELNPQEREKWHDYEKRLFGWDVPAGRDNSLLRYVEVGLLNLDAHTRGETL